MTSEIWGGHLGEVDANPQTIRELKAAGGTWLMLLNHGYEGGYGTVRHNLYEIAYQCGLPVIARDYRPAWFCNVPTPDAVAGEVADMLSYGKARLVLGNEPNVGTEVYGEEHPVTEEDIRQFVREAWPLWNRIQELGGIPLLPPMAQGGNLWHGIAYQTILDEIWKLNGGSIPAWLGAAYHCYINAEGGNGVVALYQSMNALLGWRPAEEWVTEAGLSPEATLLSPEEHREAVVGQAQLAVDGKLPPVAFWTWGRQPGFEAADLRNWPQTIEALKRIRREEKPMPDKPKIYIAVMPSNQDRNVSSLQPYPFVGYNEGWNMHWLAIEKIVPACTAKGIIARAFWAGPESSDFPAGTLSVLKAQYANAKAWLNSMPATDVTAMVAHHTDSGATPHTYGIFGGSPIARRDKSFTLARAIADPVGTVFGHPPPQGVFDQLGTTNYNQYIFVTDSAPHPSVLIELCSHQSATDLAILYGQPVEIAEAIADGILAWAGQTPTPPPAPPDDTTIGQLRAMLADRDSRIATAKMALG